MRYAIAIVVLLFCAGSDGCNDRKWIQARLEAERLTGRPMVCDGSTDDGFMCFDGRGGAVHCPADAGQKCVPVVSMMPKPCAEEGP